MSALILWWQRVLSAVRVFAAEVAAQGTLEAANDERASEEYRLRASRNIESTQRYLAVCRAKHARLLRQAERRRQDARTARDGATRT